MFWVPLIAAGIGAIGSIAGGVMQSRAMDDQIFYQKQANEIMNQQWRENMILEKRKEQRRALVDFNNKLNNDMMNNQGLKKSINQIWSGR